ncbi:hypothetical protein JHK85_035518 [Glycine max]|nr:hypothetical protein JHK85_035518 [Glycine max]
MGDDGKKMSGEGGIVKVEPKPSNGFTSKVVDLLEKLVVKFLYDSSLTHHYLTGNFAPVPETPPTKDLPVKGYLPDCLNGEFVRVGPNPKFSPVAGYHCLSVLEKCVLKVEFDAYTMLSPTVFAVNFTTQNRSSGICFSNFDLLNCRMIHGLRIKDGKATYVSRFVRTSRLKQEEYFGGSKFMKIGDLKGLFGLLMVNIHMLRTKWKVLDVSYGTGTDAIKVFEDGDLQTLGMLDYDKRLGHSFTAHPKVDPFTVSDPIMMHDFAITENYAIFLDLPLIFRPKEMVKNKTLIFSFDSTKKARFGVLPRYAKDEKLIRWFELPNCFIFHNANAWEEEDEVVLITCRLQNPNLDLVGGTAKEKLENFSNELYEMRFNMKTGEASQKKLSASAVDFPRVNESYTGRKSFVHVINAKTMSADPVAVVELPHRVPYGFHAFFVTEHATNINIIALWAGTTARAGETVKMLAASLYLS